MSTNQDEKDVNASGRGGVGHCEHSVNLIFAACLSVGGMKRDKAAVINNKQ